jgi:hypothetical protein
MTTRAHAAQGGATPRAGAGVSPGQILKLLALERLGYISSSLDNYSHDSHFASLLLVTHGICHEMFAQ